MEILLVITVGAMCIGCFLVGAKVGQTVSKGEEIQLPELDLAQISRKREARAEARKEQARVDAILQNIESYNGTSVGQIEIPR